MTTIPTHALPTDRLPHGEPTALSDHLCDGCGTPLIGRRPEARFCSDGCRTRAHRRDAGRRLQRHFDAAITALNALARELGLSEAGTPGQVRP